LNVIPAKAGIQFRRLFFIVTISPSFPRRRESNSVDQWRANAIVAALAKLDSRLRGNDGSGWAGITVLVART
jgi:hypothetical protein